MQVVIAKENNFKQAGERYRSFDAKRQVCTWQGCAVWEPALLRMLAN